MANVLVISDNPTLVSGFQRIIASHHYLGHRFTFNCSKGSEPAISEAAGMEVEAIRVKNEFAQRIIGVHDLIISLHCKQLFPSELVSAVRCINVHPGMNPYNRGWFPQVFSILNGLPTGVTIHEIDEQLDHGRIIVQEAVGNHRWDTSLDIYQRIIRKELELIERHLPQLITGEYGSFSPSEEGNLNLIKDFNALCELDLKKQQTIGETVDLLRALTHGHYQNAFFIDPETGKRVFVSIHLKPEE